MTCLGIGSFSTLVFFPSCHVTVISDGRESGYNIQGQEQEENYQESTSHCVSFYGTT